MENIFKSLASFNQSRTLRTISTSPLFWIGAVSIIALILLMATTLPATGSSNNTNECPLPSQSGRIIVDFPNWWFLMNGSDNNLEGPMSVNIPAGKYDVTLVSYDDHENKTDTQENESYYIKLYNGSTSFFTSNPISDIPNNESWRTEQINQSADISQNANKLYAQHIGGNEAGSVYPVCAAFDRIKEQEEPLDDATPFNVSTPNTFLTNETKQISFSILNNGNTRWYHGSAYKFIRTDSTPLGLSCGNLNYAHLPQIIHGQSSGHSPVSTSWNCDLTAPSTPGTYILAMRMSHSGGWAWGLEPSHQNAGTPVNTFLFGDELRTTIQVKAPPTPAPTVSLTANPTSINYNGSSTLQWSVTNATSCTASGDWSGSKNIAGGSQAVLNLINNQHYTITCAGLGGSSSDDATIFVQNKPIDPPILNLETNPSVISSGDSSVLSWNVANATSCTASGDWSGSKDSTGGTETILNIANDQTYVLTCSGGGGTTTDIATVQVRAANKPVVVLTANPSSVSSGGSTVLTWTVLNANDCSASGDWSGSKNSNASSEVRTNINSNRTYVLTCNGDGGSSTDTATVIIYNNNIPPSVSLSASPAFINYGKSTTITWSTSNATSCTASGDWAGNRSTSGGTVIQTNITSDRFYALTCIGQGGSAVDTATVNVINGGGVPSVSINTNPSLVQSGSSTTITWSANNVNFCVASGARWSGLRNVNGGSETLTNITSNRIYSMTCYGDRGSATDATTVNIINHNNTPTVSLVANPSFVSSGSSTTLSWSVQNATTCSASGNWFGSKNPFGNSETRSNIRSNKTYTLTCSGNGGTASNTATVTVQGSNNAPIVNLSASPTTVNFGNATTLNWSVNNATTCSASGAWSGFKSATNGSELRSSLTVESTYILTCSGSGGIASNTVIVGVIPNEPPPRNVNVLAGIIRDQGGAPVGGIQVDTCNWGTQTTNANGHWSVSVPERSNYCARIVNLPSGFTGATSINNTPETQSANTYEYQVSGVFCRTDGCGSSIHSTWDIANDLRNDFTVIRGIIPPPPPPGPPAPTLTFTTNPSVILVGESSTLSWTSTNTTSCSAFADWSGFKPLAGSESTEPIVDTQTYTLTCSGSGGSVTRSVSVAVEAPALPTITLTAIDLSTLEWEATEANTCSASGSWSGFKPLIGREFVGQITPETQYLLTCSGTGGTVTIAASGAANTLATTLISSNIAGTTKVTTATISDALNRLSENTNSTDNASDGGFLAAIFGGNIGVTILFWIIIIVALLLLFALILTSRRQQEAPIAAGDIPAHTTRQPQNTAPPLE